MSKKKVFISYRRDDATGFSHTIYDRLIEHLPKDHVFMDVSGIDPGDDFVKKLESTVNKCDLMLVLIGKRWEGNDPSGKIRLNDPNDWVRIEVATAIKRGIKIIPVLLDGTTMPPLWKLPSDLQPLLRMNAMDVRSSRIDRDIWDLTGHVISSLGGKWPPDEAGSKIYSLVTMTYSILTGLFAAIMILTFFVSNFFGTQGLSIIDFIAFSIFIFNSMLLLRLPIISWARNLNKKQILTLGSVIHLAASILLSITDNKNSDDHLLFFIFGIIPSAIIFLSSYATQQSSNRTQ